MWFIGVEVEQETSASPPEKNPGSAPEIKDLNTHCFVNLKCISSRFFENQPKEIFSHLSGKTSKGMFLKPEKLQNHGNKGKGKEKKKERAEGKEEKKKKQGLHS